MSPSFSPENFSLCACLPFVELGEESLIQLGPVIFWPASKSHEFLSPTDHEAFQTYFNSVGKMKSLYEAPSNAENDPLNTRGQLAQKRVTCVSLRQISQKT